MSVSRGDIVLVDYPFTDRTGSKVRPALVVQADSLNHRISDTILAAISRSTHRASATQLLIEISTADGKLTGLRQNSMIRVRICSPSISALSLKIGELSSLLLRQIETCLKAALDLP